ncbi:family 78 glycoside hydrolase catalytic domain [Paenibacillus oceani]|uniref:alpha-L-rhamnosidase n=1 Tax=Paenibacillus oceani TaxID=2772510 RepID=A0A927C793_9BACL|nr:family 78 glycoside hydrolase catalytic domain [Paenibacillus oceani]MBD2862679.1 family 78 glycoside hydrolase catalytic domain [Paenibacillus oceani]
MTGMTKQSEQSETKAAMAACSLKTEFLDRPLGIGKKMPRLGWELQADGRSRTQTGYRIIVSSSVAGVEKGEGEMWDSGRVENSRMSSIAYEGKPLSSGGRYYWRVKVWDERNRESPWSEPSYWSMGLLDEEDWQAKWIGPRPGELLVPDLDQAKWIGLRALPADTPAGEKKTYFRRLFELPKERKRHRAMLLFSAETKPFLYVNGRLIHSRAALGFRKLVLLDLTEELADGRNVLAVSVENPARLTETGGACIGTLLLVGPDGKTRLLDTDGTWKATFAPNCSGWNTADYDDSGWPAAAELAAAGERPWDSPFILPRKEIDSWRNDVYYARKEFAADRPVRRATLYASALGVYAPRLNGVPIGCDVLAPGWTDYDKRVMYQTYDVTPLIRGGRNTLASVVGEGWYAGNIGPFENAHYGTIPRLLMQLHIEFEDDSEQLVITDGTWKTSRGPIEYADLVHGEIYDARKEMPGWDEAGFADDGWEPVEEWGVEPEKLTAQIGPGVRIVEDISPVSVLKHRSGSHIIDLGQNISGWIKIRASGPAGTRIKMRFAEMLQEDGAVYTENLRNAKQTDLFILKGEGEETYEPTFTFHGFRYVEISGIEKLDADQVTGRVVHSAMPPTGTLHTSDPLLNRLYANIVWGQRDNFLSVPTDCPQRDERLGWLGDAQIFAGTASYNMDVRGFFEKWMIDVSDAQLDSGAYPDIAPNVGGYLRAGTAAWADAGIIIPWTMYLMYGDRNMIEVQYSSMQRYMAFLERESPSGVRPAEGYGDWLSIGEDTPKDVLATAYYAYCASLMEKTAMALARPADARRYGELFRHVRAAFNKRFVTSDGKIAGNTQTGYVLALHMKLLEPDMACKALAHLLDNIGRNGGHLSTGFVGVGYLLPVLTDAGEAEAAYKLLHNRTFPSWLYSVLQGATTIWERWDGWTAEKGFQTPAMNSFNHYSLGSVGEWMYRHMAGIVPDETEPGFAKFRIRPHPGGELDFVRAEYASVSGRIVSAWSIRDRKLVLDVSIPANTVAEVHVPADDEAAVYEGNVPASQAEGVDFVRRSGEYCVYRVGSGDYTFAAPATVLQAYTVL